MSASQEKKKRRELRDGGSDPRRAKEQADRKKLRRTNLFMTIGIGLIAILIVVVILVNSTLFYTTTTAVEIGGTNYTTAEFNYFYYTAYYNFVNNYSDYLSYFGLDTSQPLGSQDYSDDQTWEDYFKEQALTSLEEITMFCDMAEDAGYTLSEEDQAQVEESIASLEEAAASYEYTDIDLYCAAAYGRGSNLATVRAMIEKSVLASSYAEEFYYSNFTYTEEELEANYEENKDSYDYITYRSFFFSGAADEEAGIDEETAMETARTNAEAMAADAVDDITFADLAYNYADEDSKSTYEDEDATESTATGASITSSYSAFAEWLLSDERQEFDVTTAQTTNGYYVVMFISRNDNNYYTKNVRHILIQAEASDDGTYTDEALAAAQERAEEIYAEWQDGDATEESFAALAEEYSDDAGSNTNGGLYENVYEGQMVEEFDAFCFDPDRQPGDTGIVYGESSSYAGYHIIYFVGDGQLYRNYIAENNLRSEDYSAWETEALESYSANTHFSFRFAG